MQSTQPPGGGNPFSARIGLLIVAILVALASCETAARMVFPAPPALSASAARKSRRRNHPAGSASWHLRTRSHSDSASTTPKRSALRPSRCSPALFEWKGCRGGQRRDDNRRRESGDWTSASHESGSAPRGSKRSCVGTGRFTLAATHSRRSSVAARARPDLHWSSICSKIETPPISSAPGSTLTANWQSFAEPPPPAIFQVGIIILPPREQVSGQFVDSEY